MTRPVPSLACFAALLTATPALAGFSSGSGTYFFSSNDGGGGVGGPSPTSLTRSGNLNGVSVTEAYTSGYFLSPEPPPGPGFVQTASTSETLSIVVGGESPAGLPQRFLVTALSQSVTVLDYSGLAIPGYDEFFVASMDGVLTYHLAAGDTLSYTINGFIGDGTPGPGGVLFDRTFAETNDVPGDYVVDLTVPPTLITDLIREQMRGAVNFQATYSIQVDLTRGSGNPDPTVITFDPDVAARAMAAVPEPAALGSAGVGGLLVGLGIFSRRRRAAAIG